MSDPERIVREALDAAEIGDDGFRDAERFLGAYNPEMFYLLTADVAEVAVAALREAGWLKASADAS